MLVNDADPRTLARGSNEPRHVFIVGLPRTGTTLTRNILNRSPHIGLGGESHFFADEPRLRRWRDQSVRRQFGIRGRLTPEDASRVIAWIYRDPRQDFWGRIALAVDPDDLRAALLATDGTERSVLDLAYAIHAHGRPIRGEKTPAHLYSVPTLLEWFPDTRIIHAFRDPRAIFVSQQRKYDDRGLWGPFAALRRAGLVFDLYASLRIILAWRHAVHLHHRYRRDHAGRYALSRYEQLIADPRRSVERLCAFVGVAFSESMLEQQSINSSFEGPSRHQGFDATAVDRWRTRLHPLLRRWFALWCGRSLAALGYEP